MGPPVLLYVEDEDASAFLLETAIKEAQINLQLRRVSDGEQALAYLEHSKGYEEAPDPDLILLDLNLPRKDGLEVLAAMQQAGDRLRNIPVVVFTSSSLARDRKRSMALGARDFITKPDTFDALVDIVKSACARLDDNRSAASA
ncbi:MAG: response regulator [Acidobacteriaceae bacterium]|nr:response regulator [Acidobacteriaceae bacterium]